MRLTFVLALAITFVPFRALSANSCSAMFTEQISETRIAHEIEQALTAPDTPSEKILGKRARGFAIITATMVASAAFSTHLNSLLPKDMAFLSQLIGQVSTIGIFVLGAPIWEPISSAFRKFAFGLGKEKSEI